MRISKFFKVSKKCVGKGIVFFLACLALFFWAVKEIAWLRNAHSGKFGAALRLGKFGSVFSAERERQRSQVVIHRSANRARRHLTSVIATRTTRTTKISIYYKQNKGNFVNAMHSLLLLKYIKMSFDFFLSQRSFLI